MTASKQANRAGFPTAASNLIDTAYSCGWSYAVQWGQDIGGDVFVVVDVLGSDRRYRCTWHTRGHGSLRLFSTMDWKHSKDMPSLSAVVGAIQENPQDWVLAALRGDA